ncbi:universal stress protein A-like protein isoform X2 [Wolffia australiana]
MEQAGAKGSEQAQEKALKVMVAVDESEGSLYALSWGLDNLFSKASSMAEWGEAVVVHVQQPFQNYVFPAGPAAVYATSAVMESVKKAQQKNAEALLAKIAHLCSEKHVSVRLKSMVLEGDPKEMICQAAEQVHPDLLLIGSRGLGKIKRAFLGSVSDYCAHHAKCPVLIVKPPHK